MAICCEPGEVLPLAAPIFFTGVYVGVPGPLSGPVLRLREPAEKRMIPGPGGVHILSPQMPCSHGAPKDSMQCSWVTWRVGSPS